MNMISGLPITARAAVEQFGMEKLHGAKCVAVSVQYGDGSMQMVFGEIIDPVDCVLDEPDDSLFFVEYFSADDWYVTGIAADEQVVLLNMVAEVAVDGVVV